MEFHELREEVRGKGFSVFDDAEIVIGINARRCSSFSRKQIDALVDYVKRPQVGARGLVYIKYNEDGTFKSSIDKFYGKDDLKVITEIANAEPGDLLLIMAGEKAATQNALSELRLHLGDQLKLRNGDIFKPLWVIDFPLLEWDDELKKYHAMHHPFTSPKPGDLELLESDPGSVCANAYDLVVNGIEIGGGSIRIHDRQIQQRMFEVLGFTVKEASNQFGFLLDAFKYGAPPHGGIAFGFDRLCALFGGGESIRDFIAFPKNNAGRDVMIDSPSSINDEQLAELALKLDTKK